MNCALRGFLLFTCAAALFAQAPSSASQPAGLETDWDIRPVLTEISAHAGRLLPALDKIDANAWVQTGASDTYVAQLESSKAQARALAAGAKALAGNPERLSAALEVYFRMQGLESMLNSLEQGIRKYQGPADAEALASLSAENGANRDRFQRYIVNLAAEREQDLAVMDREAQRCRGIMTQTPPRSGRKK
jgi:hypothetical protein